MNAVPPGIRPFTILSKPTDRWTVDRSLALRLRQDAALIRAKPAAVVAVRDLTPGRRSS